MRGRGQERCGMYGGFDTSVFSEDTKRVPSTLNAHGRVEKINALSSHFKGELDGGLQGISRSGRDPLHRPKTSSTYLC